MHTTSPDPLLFDTGAGYGLPTAAVTAAAEGQLGLAPVPAAAVSLDEAGAGAAVDVVGDALAEDGALAAAAVVAGTAAVAGTAVVADAVVDDAAAECDELLHPPSARLSAGTIAISNVAGTRDLDIWVLSWPD